LRETDSLKYYVATGDTLNTVCLNEEASYYWLYNKNFKLIVDGAYILEGDKYLPDGKWTEHYENGKVKLTGYYKRNKPIGTWQEFYQNGKLMDVYNYAILLDNGDITSCLSGSYQEYYQNGKLKINGFYSAAMVDETDTQVITDPVTGLEKTAITHHSEFKNAKVGPWEYYKETGELDRKVDY
jgi:antitoxin component YwqK of YwqJK toxin-antitoxin module